MTQTEWDRGTVLIIRELMKPTITTDYINALANYLGADPALLRCLVHTGECKLAGNRIWDLRQADEALRKHLKAQEQQP